MKMDKCESCGTSGCGHCGCGCLCHKLIPALVIIYGILIFLGMTGLLIKIVNPGTAELVVGLSLPIFLIIGGLKAMFGNKCKCC